MIIHVSIFSVTAAFEMPACLKKNRVISRRSLIASSPVILLPPTAFAASDNGLTLTTTPSGLKWVDAKVGTGKALNVGSVASIDYSMATTVGRVAKIYSSQDTETQPYRWTLGDGSTVVGIEKAILGDGDEGIPPMLPGGVRRVFLPPNLAYGALATPNAKCEGEGVVGPIPPRDDGAFQRFKQNYCNPRIPYQPDVIIDIKLYGNRNIR